MHCVSLVSWPFGKRNPSFLSTKIPREMEKREGKKKKRLPFAWQKEQRQPTSRSFWNVNTRSLQGNLCWRCLIGQEVLLRLELSPFTGNFIWVKMLQMNPPYCIWGEKKKLPFFRKPPLHRKVQQADHREVPVHWCRIQFQTETLQTKGREDSPLAAKSSTQRKGHVDYERRMDSF